MIRGGIHQDKPCGFAHSSKIFAAAHHPNLCLACFAVLLILAMADDAGSDEVTGILSAAALHHEEQEEQTTARRELCNTCRRPVKVCLCDVLPNPKLSCMADVIVFQNPEEAKSAKSTIPLLELCVEGMKVVCGRKFNHHDFPERILQASSIYEDIQKCTPVAPQSLWHRTLLLWPTAESEDLEEVVQELRTPSSGVTPHDLTQERVLLVLLDGTWPACGQMLRRSVS